MSRLYDIVRKRLIVCCDGTWQSSVSGERNIPSNVTRLCRHLADSETKDGQGEDEGKRVLWKQIVHYDAGIGTGNLTKMDVDIQGGTGAGLAQNVIEAYNFLVLNYQPGDKVYCFGFSRGAYTARALSGFVTSLGICSRLDMQIFPDIYQNYEKIMPQRDGESLSIKKEREEFWGPDDQREASDACSDPYKPWRPQSGIAQQWMDGQPIHVNDKGSIFEATTKERSRIEDKSREVEVVGCWDTVGSLGVPKMFGWFKVPFIHLDKPSREFHDVSINPMVQHAFHALALDERRKPFTPTLWYVPFGQARPKGKSFKQVWFPGCHVNVGGGSDDILEEKRGDFEQTANISFAWMVEQVRPYLAFNEPSFDIAIKNQKLLLDQIAGQPLPWPKAIWRKIVAAPYRLWSMITGKKLRVQVQPGWAVASITDSFIEGGLVMWLGWIQRRTPGAQEAPESISDRRNPQTLTKMGLTNEEIHPCVYYRMVNRGSKSPAMHGWNRSPNPDSNRKGWLWTKRYSPNLEARLPEYRIAPESETQSSPRNLERRIAEANGAGEYLKILDEMYDHGIDATKKPVRMDTGSVI